jgi:hypothetical protein
MHVGIGAHPQQLVTVGAIDVDNPRRLNARLLRDEENSAPVRRDRGKGGRDAQHERGMRAIRVGAPELRLAVSATVEHELFVRQQSLMAASLQVR